MIIAATSDIHSPTWFNLFVRSLDNLNVDPDLFLIAGDLIHKGEVDEVRKVSNAVFGKISCPIVSCFGNNEYSNIREKVANDAPDLIFLDDEIYETKINGEKITILGTQGSLDRPTPWQARNIPNIETIYDERVDLIRDFLEKSKGYRILLIHYPPTHKIMTGENPSSFQYLGSSQLESVIISNKPDIVLTGHIYNGKKMTWLDSVPIFNVGLNLNQKIVVIDTEKIKPGLDKFLI
jgi:Icc-related predicted phosphoesterase